MHGTPRLTSRGRCRVTRWVLGCRWPSPVAAACERPALPREGARLQWPLEGREGQARPATASGPGHSALGCRVPRIPGRRAGLEERAGWGHAASSSPLPSGTGWGVEGHQHHRLAVASLLPSPSPSVPVCDTGLGVLHVPSSWGPSSTHPTPHQCRGETAGHTRGAKGAFIASAGVTGSRPLSRREEGVQGVLRVSGFHSGWRWQHRPREERP